MAKVIEILNCYLLIHEGSLSYHTESRNSATVWIGMPSALARPFIRKPKSRLSPVISASALQARVVGDDSHGLGVSFQLRGTGGALDGDVPPRHFQMRSLFRSLAVGMLCSMQLRNQRFPLIRLEAGKIKG